MTAKEINLAGGQKVYNKEKEDALLAAQKAELTEKIDALGENVNTKNVHVTEGIKFDALASGTPVTSSAGVGYDENGNLIPIRVVAAVGFPENAAYLRTDGQGNAKKGAVYDGVAEPSADSSNLVTESAFTKRGNAVTDVHTTTGELNENLIYRATQHTADYSLSAFNGIFYEVTSFMQSAQIPAGAKLIYAVSDTLKFCTTYPPYSGLQFGSEESVTANKVWFENIEWMRNTEGAIISIALSDFSYTTPVIKVQGAEVATQSVLSFVDYRENATDELLDKRSSETAATVKSNTANIATNTANIATNTANIATNTANIATNTEAITLTKQDILDFKDQVLTIEARKQLPAYINETVVVDYVNNVPGVSIDAISDNYALWVVATKGDQTGSLQDCVLYEIGKKRFNAVAAIKDKYYKSGYLTFVRLYDNGILDIEGVPSSGGTITNISVYDRSTNYTKESYVLDLPAPESLIRDITRCNNKFYCIAVDKNTTTQFTVFKSRATTPEVTWEQVTDTFSSEGGTTPMFWIFKDTVVVVWSEKTSTAGQSKLNAYFVEDNKTYTYTVKSTTNDAVVTLVNNYKMLQFMDKDTAVLPVYMSKNDYTIHIVHLSRSKGFTVYTISDRSETFDSSVKSTAIKTYIQTTGYTMLCSSVFGYLYNVNLRAGIITQITTDSGNITKFYWLEDVGFFAEINSGQIGFIRGSRFTYTDYPPFTNMEKYMTTSGVGFNPNYNLSSFYETPYGIVTLGAVSSGMYALYWLAYDYIKDKLYKTNTVLGLST